MCQRADKYAFSEHIAKMTRSTELNVERGRLQEMLDEVDAKLNRILNAPRTREVVVSRHEHDQSRWQVSTYDSYDIDGVHVRLFPNVVKTGMTYEGAITRANEWMEGSLRTDLRLVIEK